MVFITLLASFIIRFRVSIIGSLNSAGTVNLKVNDKKKLDLVDGTGGRASWLFSGLKDASIEAAKALQDAEDALSQITRDVTISVTSGTEIGFTMGTSDFCSCTPDTNAVHAVVATEKKYGIECKGSDGCSTLVAHERAFTARIQLFLLPTISIQIAFSKDEDGKHVSLAGQLWLTDMQVFGPLFLKDTAGLELMVAEPIHGLPESAVTSVGMFMGGYMGLFEAIAEVVRGQKDAKTLVKALKKSGKAALWTMATGSLPNLNTFTSLGPLSSASENCLTIEMKNAKTVTANLVHMRRIAAVLDVGATTVQFHAGRGVMFDLKDTWEKLEGIATKGKDETKTAGETIKELENKEGSESPSGPTDEAKKEDGESPSGPDDEANKEDDQSPSGPREEANKEGGEQSPSGPSDESNPQDGNKDPQVRRRRRRRVCFEAKMSDFPNCADYDKHGYTCVKRGSETFCASSNPSGDPSDCAVKKLGTVDKKTGRCKRARPCFEAKMSDFPNCEDYDKHGYTCVKDGAETFCASSNPSGDPSDCAVKKRGRVDKETGTGIKIR